MSSDLSSLLLLVSA